MADAARGERRVDTDEDDAQAGGEDVRQRLATAHPLARAFAARASKSRRDFASSSAGAARAG
jgi:hypothetical protein